MYELSKKLKEIGLNENQCKTYLFTLKHQRVKLSTVKEELGITTTGAVNLLNDLIKKGFILKYKAGNKVIYVPSDIELLKNKLISKENNKVIKIKDTFNEIESSFKNPSLIKTSKISAD